MSKEERQPQEPLELERGLRPAYFAPPPPAEKEGGESATVSRSEQPPPVPKPVSSSGERLTTEGNSAVKPPSPPAIPPSSQPQPRTSALPLPRRRLRPLLAVSALFALLLAGLGFGVVWAAYRDLSLPLLPEGVQRSVKAAVVSSLASLPFFRDTPYGLLARSAAELTTINSLSFDLNLKILSQSLSQGAIPLGDNLVIRVRGDFERGGPSFSGRASFSSGEFFAAEADFTCPKEDCYFSLVRAPSQIPFLDLSFLLGKWYRLPVLGEGGKGFSSVGSRLETSPEVLEGVLRGVGKAGLWRKLKKVGKENVFGVETTHLSLIVSSADLRIIAEEVYRAAAGDNLTEQEKQYFREGLEKVEKSLSGLNSDLWLGQKEPLPYRISADFRTSGISSPTLDEYGLTTDLKSVGFEIVLGLWDFNKEKSIFPPASFEEFNLENVLNRIFRVPSPSPLLPPAPGVLPLPSPESSPSAVRQDSPPA